MNLQTERLILHPFTSGDLLKFAKINADSEVMRNFSALQTAKETEKTLAAWTDKLARYGCTFAATETSQEKKVNCHGRIVAS